MGTTHMNTPAHPAGRNGLFLAWLLLLLATVLAARPQSDPLRLSKRSPMDLRLSKKRAMDLQYMGDLGDFIKDHQEEHEAEEKEEMEEDEVYPVPPIDFLEEGKRNMLRLSKRDLLRLSKRDLLRLSKR